MDMRQEIDSGDMEAAVIARPTRPTRPTGAARPAARPMQLTNPIAESEPAKAERPATPAQETDRPSRPKSTRRARVLEPDQVAASKGEDYVAPRSSARDEMLGAAEEPAPSKIGAVVQSFSQITARLKASKSEKTAKAPVQNEEAAPADDTAQASGGVLGGLRAMVARSKTQDPEPTLVVEAVVAPEPDYDDYLEDMDGPVARTAPKPSFLARFDTPMMGVLVAVMVSALGLVAVSAVLA